MKKIAFVLSILLAAGLQPVFAAPVSISAATEYAANYLGTDEVELAFTGPDYSAGFYAFNRPSGGWVIISADDCGTPVLAHSDNGKLSSDKLPVNMKENLKLMTGNISKVSRAKLSASKAIRNLWAKRGIVQATKADFSSTVLETAAWGQSDPYNQTVCSKVKNGSKTVSGLCTGCVATAMAIVLQYNGYPTAPTGTLPSYYTDSEGYTVPSVNLSNYGNYDWSNMPKTKPTTTDQKKAVADLMYHCGAMVSMDYTTEGSGAYGSDIPVALSKYMKYSPAAKECYRENYNNSEWFNILKAEIDENRPIIYGGSDVNRLEGHQFVINGYNSNNEVHVNWGWEGLCDGWFAVCYLGNYDSQDVDDVFNYYDSAILGLVPNASTGSSCPEINMFSYESDPGLSVSGTIARNETFTLKAYAYNGNHDYDYDGSVVAALVDSKGDIKETISSESSLHVDKCDGQFYGEAEITCQCKITKEINLGDFVAVFYKDGFGEWTRLGGSNHVVACTEEEDDPYYTVSCISAVPSISYIYVPESLKAGDVFYCDLVTGVKLPTSVVWSCDGTELPDYYTKLTSGKHIIKAVIKYSDNSSLTIKRNITVQ